MIDLLALYLLLMGDRFVETQYVPRITIDYVISEPFDVTLSRSIVNFEPPAPTPEPTPEPEYQTARVTAYAPFDNRSGMCNDGDPTNTSTGQYPNRRIAAVDPEKIPYGTEFYIPSLNETFVAGDTGSAMRNYDGIAIDLFVDSYEETRTWGVRYLEIEIRNGD